MKPVDQTLFGRPGGNCLAACIATILELPLDEVTVAGTDDTWLPNLAAWLAPRGLYPICFNLDSAWRPTGIYILGGKSPRGDFLHAVVAQGDDVLHDPHPSRAGVLSRADATIFVDFLGGAGISLAGRVVRADEAEILQEHEAVLVRADEAVGQALTRGALNAELKGKARDAELRLHATRRVLERLGLVAEKGGADAGR